MTECTRCGAAIRYQVVVEAGRVHNDPCGCVVAIVREADR